MSKQQKRNKGIKRSNIVEIQGHTFTVRELTIREIINYFDRATQALTPEEEKEVGGLDVFKGYLDDLVELAIEEEIDIDIFLDFKPSELKELYDTFKEVNKVFFEIARQLGASKMVDLLKEEFQQIYSVQLASSLKRDTQKPLTTDTPSLGLQ